MTINIKNRWTGADLYVSEASTLREAVEEADLEGADLEGANLYGANLEGANLEGADLEGADLEGAYFRDARNIPASLRDHKDPETPYVRRVMPPTERAAAYRAAHPDVPFDLDLDRKILAAIESGAVSLEMNAWHTCETTHCRAGLAIHLMGAKGYELERRLNSAERAGRAIYLASTGRVPHFYASNEDALKDIRKCAGEAGA